MALTKGFVTAAATTAKDTRLIEAGKFTQLATGGARSGVVGYVPTIVTATSAMRVAIARADFLIARSPSDGAVGFANDGSVNLDLPGAAPSSNSRIVAVWVKHNDADQADANSLPTFGFTLGDADPTPAVPAIPTGALLLATVLVPSTATATNSAGVVVSNVYPMTTTRGGMVPYRNSAEMVADLASAVDRSLAVLPASGATIYQRVGAAWVGVAGRDELTAVASPGFDVTIGGSSFLRRSVDGLVTAYLDLNRTTVNGGIPLGSPIGVIPGGWRPAASINFPGLLSGATTTGCTVQVRPDGNVVAFADGSTPSNPTRVTAPVVWPV